MVTKKWGELKYMDEPRADLVCSLITENKCADLLEVGFFQGKSSAYFAAILEDQGHGHLTTIDIQAVANKEPNIASVLESLGLSHRVTPIYAERSYTWVFAEMLQQDPRPQFDFCYFDGGHLWDMTGFGVVLVDMLLKPGGLLLLDDMGWTIDKSISRDPATRAKRFERFSAAEKAARPVRMVWDLILPRLGYEEKHEYKRFGWGLARKPG
jgi:predicted O-methyltransferase YrrM